MPVKSVYDSGGKVPDIEDDKPPKLSPVPKDELEETEKFMARSLKRRTMEKELRSDEQERTPAPPQETATALAPILKGYSDMMSTAMESLGKFYQAQTAAGQTSPKDTGMMEFVKFLTEEFRGMKSKLDAPGPDPLALL